MRREFQILNFAPPTSFSPASFPATSIWRLETWQEDSRGLLEATVILLESKAHYGAHCGPHDYRPTSPPLTQIEHIAFETWKRTGVVPYKYQVDFTLALDAGRDVVCIAGTGAGKPLAFVMITFIRPDAMVWIVSPLNVIEYKMARNYQKYGISAVSVNASTISPQLLEVSFPRIHCRLFTLLMQDIGFVD
jgi:hypothetical protein